MQIDEEIALDMFYKSRVYQMLVDSRYGLQTMSDTYVYDEFILELHNCMFALEDMADEDEEYNVAFYNMVDYCQNKNIPRKTMEDIVWWWVKINK